MARFKKKKESGPMTINTSSLPDIIFMLLFFFMVTTTMRQVSLIVKVKLPQASEVQKLEKKSLVSYIYIGVPTSQMRSLYGDESRIQLNDQYANIKDIAQFVEIEKASKPEPDRPLITTSLKVDQKTKMGIVTDVKQELRKVNALKINYSTLKKVDLSKK